MELGNLKVKIGADVGDFAKGMSVTEQGLVKFDKTVSQLQDQLKRFQDHLKNATNTTSVIRLNSAIGETKRRIDSIQSFKGLGVADHGNQVNKTAQAYQNWGRVIQDLPFGFYGIQNNLTQLIPSVGAAGLAFSGLVSAITFAQVGFGAWTKGMGKSREEADKMKESLDKLAESTAKEVIQLRTNLMAIRDVNIPLEQRRKAVEELRSSYGPYLKNLSDEDILSGKIGNALQRINEALRAKLMLQLLQEKITPIMKEQLELQLKNEELAKQFAFADQKAFQEQYKNRNKLRDAEKMFVIQSKIGADKARAEHAKNALAIQKTEEKMRALFEAAKPLLQNSFGLGFDGSSAKTAESIITELRKEVEKLNAQFSGKFINQAELTDGIVNAYKKAVGELAEIKAPLTLINDISMEAAPEQVKQVMRKFSEFVGKITGKDPLPVPVEVAPVVVMTDDQAKLANLGKELSRENILRILKQRGKNEVTVDGVKIKISPFVSTEVLKAGLAESEAELAAWKDKVRGLIYDTYTGLGENIAKAINGGGLQSIFAGLLDTFANFVIEWGKGAVQMGVTAMALKNLIKAPAGSIVAGIAAIAAGNLMKANLPKFAKGGMVTGPTIAMVGDNPSGREAIIPFERIGEFVNGLSPKGSGGSERLVAEISMDSLRFYLNRNENRYSKNR